MLITTPCSTILKNWVSSGQHRLKVSRNLPNPDTTIPKFSNQSTSSTRSIKSPKWHNQVIPSNESLIIRQNTVEPNPNLKIVKLDVFPDFLHGGCTGDFVFSDKLGERLRNRNHLENACTLSTIFNGGWRSSLRHQYPASSKDPWNCRHFFFFTLFSIWERRALCLKP